MTGLEYILEGLEAELALERELGVRLVECDRRLLEPAKAGGRAGGTVAPPVQADIRTGRTGAPPVQADDCTGKTAPAKAAAEVERDFVFLHDGPLTAAGAEMMAKIVAALGRTAESAPVVTGGALPRAKVHVVLGGYALKKWFPGVNAAPGQWISAAGAPNVLVTYSPGYMLRFRTVTPAVKKIKLGMWHSIQSAMRRISQ